MDTFLDVVAAEKRQQVAKRRDALPEALLREHAAQLPSRASFQSALKRLPGAAISLITEVKARAPGRENVRSLEPEDVVEDYVRGGASAVSVLTDEAYFGGSLDTLARVSRATDLPLLHKEFIVEPYQLLEGKVRGASAALILAYYFDERSLAEIVDAAHAIGIEAVVECSLYDELPRTLAVNPRIVLLNNRPIAAIPADPTETYSRGEAANAGRWWEEHSALQTWYAQGDRLLISASCVDTVKDAELIAGYPFDALLIGNAAMVAADRRTFVNSLRVGASHQQ
ncbi:MAG: indole-3-glycerol phosphate synthase [Pseudomonadota bacterium]